MFRGRFAISFAIRLNAYEEVNCFSAGLLCFYPLYAGVGLVLVVAPTIVIFHLNHRL